MPFYECTVQTDDGAHIECDVSMKRDGRPGAAGGLEFQGRVVHGTSVGGHAPIIPSLVDARFFVTTDESLDVESAEFEDLVKAKFTELLPAGAHVKRWHKRPGLM